MILLFISVFGIAATLALEMFTESDITLQDCFYNFTTREWVVNARAPLPRFVFYTFPKLLLVPAGGVLLLSCFNQNLRKKVLKLERKQCVYLFCCLAGIPLLAGTGKNFSHQHCPSELLRYGGTEEYSKILALDRKPYNRIPPHCFPAGHASGGFALFSLYFLRRKALWLVPGLALGWTMGLYQMLKGAHFLSHTLTTMFFALALSAALSPILRNSSSSSSP